MQLFSRKQVLKTKPRPKPPAQTRVAKPRKVREVIYEPAERVELESDPLLQCVQLERFGYFLANADALRHHPQYELVSKKISAVIDDMFAIVPEGFTSLGQSIGDEPGAEEITTETPAFLLARQAVTNAQYQKFVDAGAYRELTLWPEEIWPHLIDLVDQTGEHAPRYWRQGRHNARLADHPVVGVSAYEAAAYALWAGYRLPTEAEWQMAATWRIRSAANVLRRYPWGDALDIQRCNIWASNIGGTVPVDRYPNGAPPNGVLQLIGNVWEWTADEFYMTTPDGGVIVGDMRMSSIRGGAFDTYFASQATGAFRTGLVSLARAHNVGFRCALDLRANDE